MCSAPKSIGIALAAKVADILHEVFDSDPIDSQAQLKLNFSSTFAFQNFANVPNPEIYDKSNIDVPKTDRDERTDFFTLFEFLAKWDPGPTMLVQNNTTILKGFMGQSKAFRRQVIKPSVTIWAKPGPRKKPAILMKLLARAHLHIWEATTPKITGILLATTQPTSTFFSIRPDTG